MTEKQNYLQYVRVKRLRNMSPSNLGVLIGCGYHGIHHNEERNNPQCSLLALYRLIDSCPESMVQTLLFHHVPVRSELSRSALKKLIAIARSWLPSSHKSVDGQTFTAWVELMKKKFPSQEWVYIE